MRVSLRTVLRAALDVGENDGAALLCLVDDHTRKEASKGATFIRVLVPQMPSYAVGHVAKFKSQLFCIVACLQFLYGVATLQAIHFTHGESLGTNGAHEPSSCVQCIRAVN